MSPDTAVFIMFNVLGSMHIIKAVDDRNSSACIGWLCAILWCCNYYYK